MPLRYSGDDPHQQEQEIGNGKRSGEGHQDRQDVLAEDQLQHCGGGAEQNAAEGQHHGGEDGHEHIKAGGAVFGEDAGGQPPAVLPQDLEVALGPAQPLPPGLAEAGGLLVEDLRRAAVADLLPLKDVMDGELRVLCKGVEGPAAAAAHDLPAEEEGHGAR